MTAPPSLLTFLAIGVGVDDHRPWPRVVLDEPGWRALTEVLNTADWSLLGLWAEPALVHLALRDEFDGAIAIASLPCPAGRFPSLSGVRPSAQRLERMIQEMTGLVAEGLIDPRLWLDHGTWPVRHPFADPPLSASGERPAYRFLPAEGDGLHQIPVGPVHAGIIEPGHFRFHANGEAVVRLEQRFGYAHKGTERLMIGRPVDEAARLAARLSGDSTVAHSLAFARAAEAALDTPAPARADWLRALMAELERIANHLGDIGAICNDASFAFMQAHCTVLRERVLRVSADAFGHRLMMDRVTPGGVVGDLSTAAMLAIRQLLAVIGRRLEELAGIYDGKASLADRTVGTGVTAPHLIHRFAVGGFIGRAASRDLDARRSPSYPPYDQLDFEVPVLPEGDVNARLWIRIREIRASLGLIGQILDGLPEGPVRVELPARAGEGMALVESFRGEIMTWLRLGADGRVQRCHPRDPSWFQWPLLEVAIEGNIVADFPLCNKSFNCSYSGQDL